MNLKKNFAAGVLALAAFVSAGVATAAPASAAPYGCATGGGGGTVEASGWAACYQGWGSYRVKAKCKSIDIGQTYSTKYGSWKSGGSKSWVTCSYGFYSAPEYQVG